MNLRKITSLTAFLSFLLMLVTSTILYIMPQGRVAYWADWTLWGLGKEQWGNLHINTGFLFLASLLLHLYYNWKPFLSYLKDRARRLRLFTPDFTAALLVTAAVALGTYAQIPPFSSIIDFGQSIKDDAARFYGEPPYGHAELSSLKTFCDRLDLDPDKSLAALRQAGIMVDSREETVLAIAQKNGRTPMEIYTLIKPFKENGAPEGLPEEPPPGLGRRTLAEICQEYGLDCRAVVDSLAAQGYPLTPESTVKEAAERSGQDPHTFYEILRKAGQQN